MRDFIASIIATGNYVLAEMEERIQKMYLLGKITESDMTYLLALACDHADDARDGEVLAMLADLEQRVARLESQELCVWVSGMITAKGQTVLYDVDGDGVLDRCRYDGGRATTSSRPGNIEGWVKTDAQGNATHRITKVDGQIVLVPVEGDANE